MAAGEGKGWANGRTANDDPRIARAAAAHRGMQYVPRVPPEQDRRRTSAPVDTTWTPTLAYAMGLMATDGCVVDGDHVSFPSADRELVELFASCLGKHNQISPFRTATGGIAYRIQFGDVAFCRWLGGIGISGRKSLTIGAIDVPQNFVIALVRDFSTATVQSSTSVRAPTPDVARITTGSTCRQDLSVRAVRISTG